MRGAARPFLPLLAWVLLAAAGCRGSAPAAPEAAPRAPVDLRSRAEAPPLDYVEVLLGGAAAEEPLPLIVAVHGYGGSPESFGALFSELDLRARLVLPRGPIPWRQGHSWFPVPGERGSWEDSAAPISAAADRLVALIRWIEANRVTVGRPVLAGYSQGGILAFVVASRSPGVVGTAVALSGTLPLSLLPSPSLASSSSLAPVAPPKLVALHGAGDTVIPYDSARRAAERLRSLGRPVDIRAYPGVGHRPSPRMMQDFLRAVRQAAAP